MLLILLLLSFILVAVFGAYDLFAMTILALGLGITCIMVYLKKYLAAFLIAFGFLSFTVPSILHNFSPYLSNVEFPIYMETTSTFTDDYTFTLTGQTGRVQKYTKNGKFVKGWFIGPFAGTSQIELSKNNKLLVFLPNTYAIRIFDFNGNKEGEIKASLPRGFYTSDLLTDRGVEYWRKRTKTNLPKIVRNKSGQFPAINSTTFFFLPIASPLIAWAIILIGMMSVGVKNEHDDALHESDIRKY